MKKILILITTVVLSVVGMMLPGNVVKAASDGAYMSKEGSRYYFLAEDGYSKNPGTLTGSDLGEIYGRSISDFNVYIDDEGHIEKLVHDDGWGDDTILNVSWGSTSYNSFIDFYVDYDTLGDADFYTFTLNYQSEHQLSPNYKFFIQEKSIESRPGISGKDTIINNIDKPYTLDDIKRIADINALDEYYGDISHLIEVKTDGYSANNKKVGVFQITYKVTNSFGLSAEYILNVINQDSTAPVLSGPTSDTQSYTVDFNPADVINKFTVKDNHDSSLEIKLDSHDYVAKELGTFTFNLSSTDESGNKGLAVYKLIIIDDVAPVISDFTQGKIIVNYKGDFSDAKMKSSLQAIDEIDGDVTTSISVIDNPLKAEIGTYIVKYEVTDKAGNKATHERTYEVITEDIPEFWVSKNLISIEDVNKLSIEQIARIVATYENIDYTEYTVIEDEYYGNESTPGEYSIRLAMTDTNGEITQHEYTLTVFDGDTLKDPTISLWQKIKNFFSSAWRITKSVTSFIWKVVSAPFKWIGKLLGLGKTNSVVFLLNRY